jgi:regulator of protease activity HflC (stomatin/prohibitin superfamily)
LVKSFILQVESSAIILVGVFVLVAILLLIAYKSAKIVSPYERGVVERLGEFKRIVEPGLVFIIPFLEIIRKVDVREVVIDVLPQEVITKDNVGVTVDAVIYYLVMDPKRVLYNVANFEEAATKLAQTNLRDVIGGLSLDETLTSREKINAKLREILDTATDAWGVRVGRVELKRIDPPQDINEAMSRQMKAERDRRAMILEAEGKRDAAINVAQGEKRSRILRAEGEAEAVIKVAEATRKKEILIAEGQAQAIENIFGSIHIGKPTSKLLTYQYLQTLQRMADGQSTKIVVPYDVSSLMGLATTLSEVLKTPSPDEKKSVNTKKIDLAEIVEAKMKKDKKEAKS